MAKDVKQIVSMRLDPADLRRVKVIAKRLRVTDSELLRCAVKLLLQQLGPLSDSVAEGRELVSAFLNYGQELARLLDIDVRKLDWILNGDLEDEDNRVAREDLMTLLSGLVHPGVEQWMRDVISGKEQGHLFADLPRVYLHKKYVDPA